MWCVCEYIKILISWWAIHLKNCMGKKTLMKSETKIRNDKYKSKLISPIKTNRKFMGVKIYIQRHFVNLLLYCIHCAICVLDSTHDWLPFLCAYFNFNCPFTDLASHNVQQKRERKRNCKMKECKWYLMLAMVCRI